MSDKPTRKMFKNLAVGQEFQFPGDNIDRLLGIKRPYYVKWSETEYVDRSVRAAYVRKIGSGRAFTVPGRMVTPARKAMIARTIEITRERARAKHAGT